MCVVAMIKRIISYMTRHPRRLLYGGLFGFLALLLVLLAMNDRNWKPLKDKSVWQATSNYSEAGADLAIDQDLKTWWSSYFAMTFGMYFQIDVGRSV